MKEKRLRSMGLSQRRVTQRLFNNTKREEKKNMINLKNFKRE